MLKSVTKIIILAAIIFSCAGAPEEVKKEVDVEKELASYDLSVLSKIENNKLPKYVIAIISDSTEIKEANLDLAGLLQAKINKTGRVTLVDRNAMDKILEEQKLALSGLIEESSIEIGAIAGADFVLTAKIISASSQKVDKVAYDQLETKVTLQFNLLNVSTSELFKTFNAEGMSATKLITDADGNLISGAVDYATLYAEAAVNALVSIIPEFVSAFPAVGFVLRTDDSAITTDLGSNVEAAEGRIIAFISQGSAIIHPVSGEILSYEYEYFGYGIISEVRAKTSIAVTAEGVSIPGNAIAVLIN